MESQQILLQLCGRISKGVHTTQLKDPAESSKCGKQHFLLKDVVFPLYICHALTLIIYCYRLGIHSSLRKIVASCYSALQYAKAAFTVHHASS